MAGRADDPRLTLLLVLIGLPGDGPDLAELSLHLLPRIARILTGVDLTKQAVCEDALGFGRVDGESVERRVGLHRQRQSPPALAAIRGPLEVATGANSAVPTGRKDDLGGVGLDRNPAAVGGG